MLRYHKQYKQSNECQRKQRYLEGKYAQHWQSDSFPEEVMLQSWTISAPGAPLKGTSTAWDTAEKWAPGAESDKKERQRPEVPDGERRPCHNGTRPTIYRNVCWLQPLLGWFMWLARQAVNEHPGKGKEITGAPYEQAQRQCLRHFSPQTLYFSNLHK